MIGIIGAMAIEVDNLIAKLDGADTKTYSGVNFVSGKIFGADVVIAKCGMGKVNAAICAQTMILMYRTKIVINTGVAGAVSPLVDIGDIVIAKSAVQHDMDLSPIGLKKGFIHEIGAIFIPCAPAIVYHLEKAAQKVGGNYYVGAVATGDQFINTGGAKNYITENFGGLACEMEGGAIAHVCAVNGVSCGIVRTISDNANNDSPEDFNEFLNEAAEKSVKIMCEFLSLQGEN